MTGNVFGADRSTAFLGLLFIFSLVDCTTSVLYIPYLSKFQSKFVFPLFVGEGLSGLIPSIISLVQGTADAAGDHHGLYFSVSTYFVILSVLLAISWLAFWLLNSDHFIDDFRRTSTVPGERTPIFNGPRTNNQTNNHSASDPSPVIQVSITTASSPVHPLSPHQTLALLVLQALTSCFANSVLSGLQTYTAMPYGLSAYHLACNLALFASPSASLLAFFFDPNPIDTNSPMSAIESNNLHYFDLPTNDQSTCGRGWKRLVAGDQRMFSLQLSTVIQFICAAYLLALAAVHKNVPAIDSWLGPTLMISAWVGFSFFASLCKTLICSLLRTRGSESSLFRYGVYTQVGSLLGAVPTFVVTNFTNYFR